MTPAWTWRVVLAAVVAGVVCLSAASSRQTAPNQDPKKDEPPRFKLTGFQFVNVFAGVTDARGVDEAKAAKTINEKFQAAGDGKNLGAIAELFQEHPFSVVEKVAKNKALTGTEAEGLALMRRQMINEAMSRTIEAIDPQKQLTIGMLDSGNKNSGIASDVDQTVFVMPKDKAKQLNINEDNVIEMFNKKFFELYKVRPDRLGIESLNGADFFPDWRQVHSTEDVSTGGSELAKEATALMNEVDRVVGEKRKNPEAYRSEGQLKSQAEGRGYEALQEHSQRMRDLDEARDKIEEFSADTTLSEGDRKARIAEAENALLKKYEKNYPSADLSELEKKFNKDSPWTEVGWDEGGKVSTSQLEDPAGKVLANKPEFHDRFAFDGAWDNWIMFEHHPHNRRKYLLRSVAEGISLRRQQAGALSTFEYEKVFAKNTAQSKQELKSFVDDVYRDLPDGTREQFKRAMDVAAKERLRHKGVKNPSTGQDYTLKEVFSEFWPAMTEAERAMYRDVPPASLDKLLAERAVRSWESIGREVMIENLVRTVSAPASMLQTPMSEAEFSKIREKFPDATRAKLSTVIERQLYHGLHDLITIDHARELVATPEQKKALKPRQKDLVDRLLEKLGGDNSELGRQVTRIARAAAFTRVASEPGERTFRQEVYSYMRDSVKEMVSEKIDAVKEVYEKASALYEDYRQGRMTQEHVVRTLTVAAAEHVASLKLQGLHAMGFDVSDAAILIPEEGWPKVDINLSWEKWSPGQLAGHVASMGSVDSALTIWVAYKEGGASAAAWAAGFEAMMTFPPFAHANALKELVVDHRPQGVVMMGSAMLIPGLGEVYMAINIAKNSVTLLGHYVLDPLHDDDADKMYQGFLDARSGFRNVERSQRPSLLHFVPIRVIPTTITTPEGKTVPTLVWQRYTAEEAAPLFDVVDEKEYNKLSAAGILGGGPEWDAAFAGVRDAIANPVGQFEAKRASMYYQFATPIKTALAARDLDPDDPAAMPIIADYFMKYVDDWVNAKGAFAGFDENVSISRRFEDRALRQRIAGRAAADFVYSYKIVYGSVIDEGTVEHNIEARIEQFRAQDTANDANAMIVALDEAWKLNPNMDLAHAIDQEMEKRKEDARVRSPRFHPWPRLVTVKDDKSADAAGEERQNVEFTISVTDGPEAHERVPANHDYTTSVRYQLEVVSPEEVEVTAFIQVTGAQTGEKIPPFVPPGQDNFSRTPQNELAIKLGRMVRPYSLTQRSDLKVAFRLKDAVAQAKAAAAAATATVAAAAKPDEKPAKGQTTTDGAGTLFDDLTSVKAAPRSDTWGGQPVSSMRGQAWVCWEKAPLDQVYFYEIAVSGGAQKYDHATGGSVGAHDKFPDGKDPSGRSNVFILPFDWPEGNVGGFSVKGTVYAFDRNQNVSEANWKSATPIDKFEFTQPFEIPDQRPMGPSQLVIQYSRALTAAEVQANPQIPAQDKPRLAGYAGTGTTSVKLFEPFDSGRADLFLHAWGDFDPAKVGGFTPRVNVRWKDVPPNAAYYYELTVRGGAPAIDTTETNAIQPTDDFPPAPYKSGPGSSAFSIEVPSPFYRGGRIDVTGTLYAVPNGSYSGDAWKKVKPLATLPFRETLDLHNRSRFAKGTYRVSDDGSVSLMILLAYVQEGRRVAKVDAGGKTAYSFIDEYYYNGGYFPEKPRPSHWVVVKMPFGASAPSTATVSFMDFGERVTMTVPLAPEAPPGDVARYRANIAASDRQTQADIQKWSANEEANLDPLARAYQDLATHQRPIDYSQWKQYTLKSAGYWARNFEKETQRYIVNHFDMDQLHWIIIENYEGLWWGAAEWGNPGDMIGEFNSFVGKVQGSGLSAKEMNSRLSGLYNSLAEAIVTTTGDLAQASTAWQKGYDYKTKVPGFQPSAVPEKNPYEINPSFRER